MAIRQKSSKGHVLRYQQPTRKGLRSRAKGVTRNEKLGVPSKRIGTTKREILLSVSLNRRVPDGKHGGLVGGG